jgi:hypothetical protein
MIEWYDEAIEINRLIDNLCAPQSVCKSEIAAILSNFDSRDIYQMKEVTINNSEVMEKVRICNNLSNEQIWECNESISWLYRGDRTEIWRLLRKQILLWHVSNEGIKKLLSTAEKLKFIN